MMCNSADSRFVIYVASWKNEIRLTHTFHVFPLSHFFFAVLEIFFRLTIRMVKYAWLDFVQVEKKEEEEVDEGPVTETLLVN